MIKARQLDKMVKEEGRNFQAKFREALGIEIKENENGVFPAKFDRAKQQIGADEFSIRDITEYYLGQEVVADAHSTKHGDSVMLREMLNPALPSTFNQINAWSQAIGGLIEARLLENYLLPENIADQLFETQPTRVNGGRLIGLPNLQLSDDFTQTGEEYPAISMQQRWVIAQQNQKKGKSLSIAREDVVYDLTGEVLNAAASTGLTLGYEREYWMAGVAQGVNFPVATPGYSKGLTNNTFIYCGQYTDPFNSTYQTASGTGTSAKYNYVNSLSNPLTNFADVQQVVALLNLMREYETGLPIRTKMEQIIVSPNVLMQAQAIIHATQIFPISGASGGLSASGGVGTFATNPIPQNVNLIASQTWNKVLVDSGVSQTNADIYWYAGDFKKAFVWREVWPMQVIQSNPTVPEMLSRDIVAAYFASWYGVPVVRDPHQVIQNTN